MTQTTIPKIPSDLLEAISNPPTGRVAFILGAGCSKEDPTSLPLSNECSEEAFRKLVEDHILSQADCTDPKDLSVVADAVYAKRNSQRELVCRLPFQRFRTAKANEGYEVAAALLVEQAIGNALTLNYDLAFQHALANINSRDEVALILRPDDHGQLGNCNLIYLHRDANADPEEWILRKAQLDKAWRDGWEEVIATRIASTPLLVFAGLGYPAAVLVETVQRVKMALQGKVSIYYVDPAEFGSSLFASALNLKEEQHIRMTWGEFMSHLAERVVLEHINRLRRACDELIAVNGIPSENCEQLLEGMRRLGLLNLGRLRASWQAESNHYASDRQNVSRHLADIILTIALLERLGAATSRVSPDGQIYLFKGDKCICTIVPISGRKLTRTIASLEPVIRQRIRALNDSLIKKPVLFLLAGVDGRQEEITLPEDIVSGANPESVVVRREPLPCYHVPDVRKDPTIVLGAIANA